MDGYKHIEHCVGTYIAAQYTAPVEIGIGNNSSTAQVIHDAGLVTRAVDIRPCLLPDWISFTRDNIFEPDLLLYSGADVIYAVRPAEEMIPPLIALARRLSCDLIVYHLGFESYGNGGEIIDCGVLLHRYYRAGETSGQ
ncbi:MAG: UPF0146 family protein [Methanoregula sp.]|jgi:hypothetical protein